MSDVTLRDQALVELKKTRVGYTQLKVRPPVDRKSAWYKGLEPLKQITGTDVAIAIAELQQTGVSYTEWQRRVQAGVYTPPDGSTTHWGKALAALARIGGTTPQFGAKLRAAFPPLPAPQKVVENRTLGNVSDNDSDVLYRNNEHTVSNSGHGMQIHGGAKRVTIERARIHDAPGQSLSEGHDGSRQGIATWAGDGTPEDLRVIGGEVWDIGGMKWSHGLYFSAVKRALVQTHYAHDIGDFVYQFYPGQSGVDSTAHIVNTTWGWARSGTGCALVCWAESGSWVTHVYNSIPWGDVWAEGDAEIHLHNVILPPQFDIIERNGGRVILDNVLRIDPKLDAQRRPTAPDAFALADSDWMPALDYKGTPYTRPTIGAVAA